MRIMIISKEEQEEPDIIEDKECISPHVNNL